MLAIPINAHCHSTDVVNIGTSQYSLILESCNYPLGVNICGACYCWWAMKIIRISLIYEYGDIGELIHTWWEAAFDVWDSKNHLRYINLTERRVVWECVG